MLRSRLISLLLNRYTIFFALLLGYCQLMQPYGALASLWSAPRLEAPLLAYLYFLLNRLLRPSRWQPVLAALPLLVLYVIADAYYLVYGRFLRLVEITELPEMIDVLPGSYLTLIAVGVGLPCGLFLYSLDWRRWRTCCLAALPALALGATIYLTPEAFLARFQALGREIVTWSDVVSVENNGRLAMLGYFEAQRQASLHKTRSYRDDPSMGSQMAALAEELKTSGNGRNVHLLVLESFLDPKLFAGLKFSADPVFPDYQKLVRKKEGFSISPVFGGGTAQAEFEILCGVPAFKELSSVEFNAFTGNRTYCLPTILAEAGYRTLATNSYKPNFFNAIPAYRGAGFEEIYFPQEYAPGLESYLQAGNTEKEWYMFDGDLFRQNEAFLRSSRTPEDPRPVFNYVISIYGHLPHYLDESKRPQFIKLLTDYRDEQLERAVNQHYYRTREIARHVQALLKDDPKSLIILVSDHVPPLSFGPDTYKKLHYLKNIDNSIHYNRILILENGKAAKYNTMHHYDIPKVVLNYLTKGQYCREHDCNFNELNQATRDNQPLFDAYMTIMAHATE
jgi:Sulfatase